MYYAHEITVDGFTVYLDYEEDILLGGALSLNAISTEIGDDVYKLVKKNVDVGEIVITLYLKDLVDKYGNEIPVREAKNCVFTIEDLNEVRKYRDAGSYTIDKELFLKSMIVNGEYHYLWK